jgi:hypothetical protein
MNQCWLAESYQRPSFADLNTVLEQESFKLGVESYAYNVAV